MPIPTSTYRLQIQRDFTLDDAAGLVDYLRELGVGAVYLSPVLQATTGSPHGYDTTDLTRSTPTAGARKVCGRCWTAARDAGLGVVIDIVPNHLGISVPAENPAWWDVLRLGPESAYAGWFDIDWSRDRIVVPVLGDDATLSRAGRRAALLRAPVPAGARDPGLRATTPTRCTPGSTTSWCTTPAATPS